MQRWYDCLRDNQPRANALNSWVPFSHVFILFTFFLLVKLSVNWSDLPLTCILREKSIEYRELIVKLVKQGNTVVEFLKEFQVEEVGLEDLEIGIGLPPLHDNEERVKRTEDLKELIDGLLEKHSELKELEDELRKYKNEITPGQVGEA